MKRSFVHLLLPIALMACNSEKKDTAGDAPVAATTKVDSAHEPLDTAATNKAWAAYMSPGKVHQLMAKSNGKWNAEMSFYQTPGGAPSIYQASTVNQMILGGRYQKSTYKGMMDGMPFEGESITAYDNARKIYISTWIDNMGTGMMYLEGTYHEATQTITFKGKATDVTTGKDFKTRETLKFVDDNTQLMEMFDEKDGKEAKTMAIKLTRAK